MKIVLAIIQDQDAHRLSKKFTETNVRATKLSTTGSFLKSGNTTFIIGIEDERVEEVLELIKETCEAREQYMPNPTTSIDPTIDTFIGTTIKVPIGGATVFVLPVDSFHQF
ncbi:cyclic-di-AMP receptor [Vagococcus xieshaowenii]|uniref:Uncharacterized protein n=1 Tax=Vagococcus xieshaowenii TaxID=2562451 RepID=A0AAJ5EEX1_9ENTE|nr:cyclic-di-AMP receptor [Vagococcus xieshaowenii]QCA29093.1 hypothetical protein E4Z98_07110 [Vagococcus xieshaowenii]TFZ40931.1 hypothetical protein E4031_05985 [Vagococcus xieshaowenii]